MYIVFFVWYLVRGILSLFFFQIEEGLVLNVAGALIIEHPLILPYVKEVVSSLIYNLHFYQFKFYLTSELSIPSLSVLARFFVCGCLPRAADFG